MTPARSLIGSLLGTAVGDAIGLPYEGLSRRRAAKLLGPPDRHRFLFRWGMVSDDTEHSCMVAQALIASACDPTRFRKSLAWRVRWWLLGLPAGCGIATGKAILKLWCGVPSDRSGVFSAGNGPAMRAPIFGALLDNTEQLRTLVRTSTRLTHTDPKAEYGAHAVALAARAARRAQLPSPAEFVDELRTELGAEADELLELVTRAAGSVTRGESTEAFADSLGWTERVSGYVYQTVPVALHAWLRHPRDLRAAVTAVINCGGDADSTAAIVGGIVGASVGEEGIPEEWLSGLAEWPRSVHWIRTLGTRLADSRADRSVKPLRMSVAGVLTRNLLFLIVVLFHGFRRLAPPY